MSSRALSRYGNCITDTITPVDMYTDDAEVAQREKNTAAATVALGVTMSCSLSFHMNEIIEM